MAPNVYGQPGVRSFLGDLKAAFPDLQLIIEDILGAGDKVVVRFVVEGTHLGVVAGVAPTSRHVRFNNINIYRFEAGRVAETWQLADAQGLMAQIS
jgi:predicted ester cyclase